MTKPTKKEYVVRCQNPKCKGELWAMAVSPYNKNIAACYLCGMRIDGEMGDNQAITELKKRGRDE